MRAAKFWITAVLVLIMIGTDVPIILGQEPPQIWVNNTREALYRIDDADMISSGAVLDGIYRWSFWMDADTFGIPDPTISLLSLYSPSNFLTIEPEPMLSTENGHYRYDWSVLNDIPPDGSGADVYIESNILATFTPGIDSERIVDPIKVSESSEVQTVTVRATPREDFSRIQVTISWYETDQISGTLVSASPSPTEIGSDYVRWNYPGIVRDTTYEFTVQLTISNKVYPAPVVHKPQVLVRGQYPATEYTETAESITRSDTILGDATYSANSTQGPYTWNYLTRERKAVIYRQKSQITGPSLLADIARMQRFVETDDDTIQSNASLTGAYVWNFWMDNLGTTTATSPAISLSTQYPRQTFPYVEPEPMVTPNGTAYRYNWGVFGDIPVGGYGADVYMESDIPVTFTPGIDSERVVTPNEITAPSETQTVTVRVTPWESFQRIRVRIVADETESTSGSFVSASPSPTETGPNYVEWRYYDFQVGLTYEFTAQFLVENKIHPAVVVHKPRVRVEGQTISQGTGPTGNTFTMPDTVLGNVTYAAQPTDGPYSWTYLAYEQRVVVYAQKSEMAPGQGLANVRYRGVRRELTQNLLLQPGQSVVFSPPPQEGWSVTQTRLVIRNITLSTGQLAGSLDEVYSLIDIQGAHTGYFTFLSWWNSVESANNAGTTSIILKNKSPEPITIQTVRAHYNYVSKTGIRPVAVLNLGNDLRRVDVTVPSGFLERYVGFFNHRFVLSVDWWDVGRTIPEAIFSPDPETGNPSSRDLLALYRNSDAGADWRFFDVWSEGVDITLSSNASWGYITEDGKLVWESYSGLREQGETIEGTWSILLRVLDENHIRDYTIPGTRLEGSLRLQKRVLWNAPITLNPGEPKTLTAPKIPGWYREETDYLYIIPDPGNPTDVSTEMVMVSPALRAGHYWYEYSADWHPLGGTVTLQLDSAVTEPVTFLYTYIVSYFTNLPTANITILDTQTSEGNYIRHDLAITLPKYSTYADLGFDDPSFASDLSLWTPTENWLLGDLYTPQGMSAEDRRLRNTSYNWLPDSQDDGRALNAVYSYKYGLGSDLWIESIYNIMSASGYSASGTWHWTIWEPVVTVSTDATVTYEGRHRDEFNDITITPGGNWSYTVPAPPDGWVFNWFQADLYGLNISQDDLLSGNVLRVTGAHLNYFKFDTDNYAAYTNDPQSLSITIENLSPNTVTVSSVSIRSTYIDVKDIHSVEVYNTPPDFRTIYVYVPYGFVSEHTSFFNWMLGFRLRWQGNTLPMHVYSPGPVGKYIDILQVYKTEENAFGRVMRWRQNSVVVVLSSLFSDFKVPVEGNWRLDMQVLSQTPTQGSSLLRVEAFNQKEIGQTFELAAGGAPGDSMTIAPPTIPGWTRWYTYDFLTVTSDTPGVDAESLTASPATRACGALSCSNWVTYGETVTVRNTATQEANFTIAYRVYYRTLLPFTDTTSQEGDWTRHEISYVLPSYSEYHDIGFDNPGLDSGVQIVTPLTSPTWRFSSFTTPSGLSADDQSLNNPAVEVDVDYWEGCTLATFYGAGFASTDYVYAVLGDDAAGTWEITAFEPSILLRFGLASPADLLVTDPLGRQVGFNGLTQINEIPGATYTGPASEPEIITIPSPLPGTYEVQVRGTGTGTYTLTTETSVAGLETSEQTTTGTISQGTTLTLTLPLENPEGMPEMGPVTPVEKPYTISYLPPIALPDFQPKAGTTIPIKFTVNSTSTGKFVFDASVVVNVYAPDGTLVQTFTYGTGDDSVRIDTAVPQYIVNLHTKKSAASGTYIVTVTFGNSYSESSSFILTAKK